MLNSFYTFSKAINDADGDGGAGGVTFYNRSLEKGRANYDIRHRFVNVTTYELPFGRGRKWMNGGGVLNAILGGWEIAYTQTFQSGPPFTIGFSGSPNRYLPGAARPNQILPEAKVDNWDLGPHRFPTSAQNPYLDINAFSYPDAYTPGTLGRNTVEAPGIIWPQFSLSKEWTFFERAKFILRWDMNNPFKNGQYGVPDATYNPRNVNTFGRIGTSVRGGFSDIGTANTNSLLVLRIEF
jgi:hypothetical protein